jgi:hypothetical protein
MELNCDLVKHVQLLIDNRSAINLAKIHVSHDKFEALREGLGIVCVEVMD